MRRKRNVITMVSVLVLSMSCSTAAAVEAAPGQRMTAFLTVRDGISEEADRQNSRVEMHEPDTSAEVTEPDTPEEAAGPEAAADPVPAAAETPDQEPAAAETLDQRAAAADTPEQGTAAADTPDQGTAAADTPDQGAAAADTPDQGTAAEKEATVLPDSYDPRPDQVSAIRDQQWGTCYAFAGIAAVESALISRSLTDNTIDLAEEDILWWANCNPVGGWTRFFRSDGGFPAMVTGYLETVGVRAEEDIPYFGMPEGYETGDDGDRYGTGGNQKPENYDTAPVLYDITDITFLENSETTGQEAVKRLILENGAVTGAYLNNSDMFNEETAAYWHPAQEEMEPDHFISVVGWDDHFPRENFNPVDGKLPEKDGAWLVKNSFGQDYGAEGGFIHISYEDGFLFKPGELLYSYSISGIRPHLEQKRYSHDEFGAVSSWTPEGGKTAVFANVFDFGPEERLSEISFVTWSEGADYQLSYAPMDGGLPAADSSSWLPLASGTVGHDGYMTVQADKSFDLPEGKGAIILSLTGDAPAIGTDENLMRHRRPLFNTSVDKGSAFILENGIFTPFTVVRKMSEYTEETYEADADICLRAYTVPEDAADAVE